MEHSSADRRSVILLGASNLTLGWKPLIGTLRQTVTGDIDLNVALGMGRSYVNWSQFGFRKLPGIATCGLWENLQSASPPSASPPPLVLFTDIGNDIVYRYSVETIVDSVRECLSRILTWRSDAEIVMAGVPISSLRSLERRRFLIARTLLFPTSRLSLSEVLHQSHTLDDALRDLTNQYEISYVAPEAEWYGLDPIHVISSKRPEAFSRFFSHWNVVSSADNPPLTDAGHLRLPTTHLRTVLGICRTVSQPAYQSGALRISAW